MPDNKTERLTIRLTKEDRDTVNRLATEAQMSVGRFLCMLIRNANG